MARGAELNSGKFIARAFRENTAKTGFSIGCRPPWSTDAEVPEVKQKRHYFKKREDPERMSMRALREALCTYAGPRGRRCEACALCAYGRNWVRRSKEDEA